MDNFKKKVKELIAKGLIITALTGTGAVMAIDIMLHPENYATTYEGYEGRPTISQVVERIDDNFNEIKENIKKGRK